MDARGNPGSSDPAAEWVGLSGNEPCDVHRYNSSRLAPFEHTGTLYPCVDHDLADIYSGPTNEVLIKSAPWDAGTYENVTRILERQPDISNMSPPDVRAAIARLQTIPDIHPWGPDIVYKAFNDLDVAFFGGRLRGACRLRWRNRKGLMQQDPDDPCAGEGFGSTRWFVKMIKHKGRFSPRPVAHIELNASVIFYDEPIPRRSRYREMWGTLLHEMIHAYLIIMTWGFASIDPRESPPCHGQHFQRCLWAVNRMSAKTIDLLGIYEGIWVLPAPDPEPDALLTEAEIAERKLKKDILRAAKACQDMYGDGSTWATIQKKALAGRKQ
ncbi:hypothetical protein MMC24_005001 [Lignoscripta atroalba]|nr:hypothetical protein [Lignoscripta atroalba]